MSMHVIGGLTALLLLFGLIICFIGNRCIVSAFKNEYATVTHHMADSEAVYVNGDHIDDYLEGREQEEYSATRQALDVCCRKLNVSLIYVIKVVRGLKKTEEQMAVLEEAVRASREPQG